MTNLAQSHIKVSSNATQSAFMENFFSLEQLLRLSPFFRYFSCFQTCSFTVYDTQMMKRFSASSYLFGAMSRLYLHVILERGHLLLD